MTAETHIQRQKHRQEATRKNVQKLTGLDDLQYGEMQFDYAYAYLDRVIRCDAFGVEVLTQSRLFWTWWVNQWIRRDEDFLRIHGKSRTGKRMYKLMLRLYRNHHSIKNLRCYPNRVVLEDSYEIMIDRLTKQMAHENTRTG